MAKKNELLERVKKNTRNRNTQYVYQTWPDEIRNELIELFDLRIEHEGTVSLPGIIKTLREDFPEAGCLKKVSPSSMKNWYNVHCDEKKSD